MLYATLSDSLAYQLPFLEDPFRFVSNLLGDETNPTPREYDPKRGQYYVGFMRTATKQRIKETTAPFRALALGVKSIFSLYLKGNESINSEQIFRDIFQPFIGILNVVRGVVGLLVGLLVGLAGLLYMIIPLPIFTLYCIYGDNTYNYAHAAHAWTDLGHFMLNTLGWIVEGFGQVVHGATQIVFAPLTWLSMLVRAPLTAAISYRQTNAQQYIIDLEEEKPKEGDHNQYVDPNANAQGQNPPPPYYPLDMGQGNQQLVGYGPSQFPQPQPMATPYYDVNNQSYYQPPIFQQPPQPMPVYVVPDNPNQQQPGGVCYVNSPPASF